MPNLTYSVEFPDGITRQVEPISHEIDGGGPIAPRGKISFMKPVFDIPGHIVMESVDGRFIAIKPPMD